MILLLPTSRPKRRGPSAVEEVTGTGVTIISLPLALLPLLPPEEALELGGEFVA